jgi:DNA repair protein SbcC/Rad50
MRPLRLELQGFTCFRDFTVIDFSNLELFAIVGQTGAGKSSILDALTFALFEQTPRLGSKPAKELIAQGSSGMSLALEFEASDGRKYRVARTYSSKSSEVRFERLENEKWVTAVEQIKKKEVAEAIERTVGLDFEGFTRAVLLPQGEFDRFLRGEPKQRRDLLKNLIGLERIENIQKRSGELAREAKTKSETLQIQLESLIAATPEALEALETTQVQKQLQLEQVSLQLEQQKIRLLEAREIRRLETALQNAKLEWQALEAAQANIELMQTQAKVARRVAGILPLLEQTTKLEARLLQTQLEAETAEQNLQIAQNLERQHLEALETAREAALSTNQLEAQVAALTALLPRLERLEALGGSLSQTATGEPFSEAAWSELERLAAELPLLERSQKQLKELERRRTELGTTHVRLEEAQTALLEQQQALREIEEKQIEQTNTLETAREAALQIPVLEEELRQLEALKPKLKRLHELGGQLEDASPDAPSFSEQAWTRVVTVQNELKTHARMVKQTSSIKTELETARDALLQWEAQLEETKTVQQTVLNDGKNAATIQKELEVKLEAAKRENIAAELVRDLSLGDPCPVCGQPLKNLPDLSGSNVPNAEKAVQAGLLEVSRLRDEYTRLKEAAKNHQQNRTRASQEVTRIEQTLRETNTELEQLLHSWQDVLDDFNDPKSALQTARAALLSGLAKELNQATNLETRLKELQQHKTQLQQNERNATEQLSQTKALLSSSQSRLEAAHSLLESRQLEQKNALQESLRLEQQRLEIEIERKALIVKLEARLGKHTHANVALQEAKQKLLGAFADELIKAGANQNLKSEIENLKTKRQQLEQFERQAREVYSNAKTQTASLKSALEATRQHLSSLLQETKQAQEISQAKLKELGFSDHQTAQNQSLPEAEILVLEEGIQKHVQNQILIQQRQNEINLELGGRKLKTQPEELEQQTQNLEQQSQDLRRKLGQLEAEKIQLNQQIKQAKDLRRQQNTLEKRFDIYAALSLDMKGNEFQDYLLAGVQQQLLQRATKTMQEITRERYTLELIDTEFHVRDAWNGLEARGVKTLSGGESFIASLSLALSLSDYLAGSQALGALFLDEGFGTLDADALEMVANTLENLQTQGRMVGVITHVPSLADRLPMRLLIEKAQDTSRVRWDV